MMYAKHWRKMDKVRVVSIGFKHIIDEGFKDLEVMNSFRWFENLEKILIDAEVTTHSDLTKNIANEYFRFEYPSIVNRFEIDENSIL